LRLCLKDGKRRSLDGKENRLDGKGIALPHSKAAKPLSLDNMKPKTIPHDSRQTSRRQFAKSVATTLIAAPLAASMANAQTPTKKEPAAPPNPQASPASQKPSPLADAYTEAARVRFGEKLTPEQLEQVRKDLDGNVRAADRLRAVKLKNADEPDFTFDAG
jgi:hypothetical protein